MCADSMRNHIITEMKRGNDAVYGGRPLEAKLQIYDQKCLMAVCINVIRDADVFGMDFAPFIRRLYPITSNPKVLNKSTLIDHPLCTIHLSYQISSSSNIIIFIQRRWTHTQRFLTVAQPSAAGHVDWNTKHE